MPSPAPARDVGGDVVAAVLFDAAPDALLGLDAEGRVVAVNARTEALFGFSRREMMGEPADRLLSRGAYSRPSTLAVLQAGGGRFTGRRRDGSEFPADVRVGAVSTTDGSYLSVAVREAREPAGPTAQRREQLGCLAGGIAHDFNNVLGVIVNYATFVAEELESATGEPGGRWATARLDIAQVQRAGQVAVNLAQQLLWLSRAGTTGSRRLDVNDVVATVEGLVRRALGPDVELVLQTEERLDTVVVDEEHLGRLLVGVALEARAALPVGGHFTVETSTAAIDAETARRHPGLEARRHVQLRMSVDGPSIDAGRVVRAFDSFLVPGTAADVTSAGLRAVYSRIGDAAAYVELLREPDRGTTLRALLPVPDRPGLDHSGPGRTSR